MPTTKTPAPPLDDMREALKGMGETLRAGGRDLFGDVKTLVQSARRDTTKTGKAVYADGEKLVKAVRRLQAPAPPPAPRQVPPPARRRRAAPRAKKVVA
jgi:hypothetical protein